MGYGKGQSRSPRSLFPLGLHQCRHVLATTLEAEWTSAKRVDIFYTRAFLVAAAIDKIALTY